SWVGGARVLDWAVKLYTGTVIARQPTAHSRQIVLLGLDDATLLGAPRKMLQGQLSDLHRPDAVVIDKSGYEYLFPGEPVELGRTIEINDRRGVIVGICDAMPPFMTMPIVYTRYSLAEKFAPAQRTQLSF